MFKGMDMNQILEKAKEMQKNMQDQKDKSANETVEATVGGGMVKATMNGKMELVKLELDPEVVDKDEIDTLEDLIRAAVNEAVRQASELSGPSMTDVLGGMGMPDLSNFDFSKFGKK